VVMAAGPSIELSMMRTPARGAVVVPMDDLVVWWAPSGVP
jgi:hypothetical protein